MWLLGGLRGSPPSYVASLKGFARSRKAAIVSGDERTDAEMALIIVAGESGQHAAMVYEAATLSNLTVAGFAAINGASPDAILNCKPLGGLDNVAGSAIASGMRFIVACGSNALRRRLTEQLAARGAVFQSVVHPAAIVSPSASIGSGSALLAGAIIGPRAILGRAVIINHAASVDHDCIVEDYGNISPGARLGGCVRCEAGVFVGLNASIIQGLRIRENAVVGAGAVVTRDVDRGSTVVGIPARRIREP